ncbi:hypothetical protein [Variovorax sp. YR566]|uniref:hypothetical protein n=1 Tax=Variovorax sp. YR566 TaxID=3450237 RepID=UPI003F7F637C
MQNSAFASISSARKACVEGISQASPWKPRLAREETYEQARHSFCPARVPVPVEETRFGNCHWTGPVATTNESVGGNGWALELRAVSLRGHKAFTKRRRAEGKFSSVQFSSVQFSSVQFSSVQFSSAHRPIEQKEDRLVSDAMEDGDLTRP